MVGTITVENAGHHYKFSREIHTALQEIQTVIFFLFDIQLSDSSQLKHIQ